jgi:hypothetical protein
VYRATSGFCVGKTETRAAPGGSISFAAPQPTVRPHITKITGKRHDCSGADVFIV